MPHINPTVLSTLLLAVTVSATTRATAQPGEGVQRFVEQARPNSSTVNFLMGSRTLGRLARRVGLGFMTRSRKLMQVTQSDLSQLTQLTQGNYLEAIVPAGKGHIYFRYGNQVFDFGHQQPQFRVSGVNPVGSERYGFLIRLRPEERQRLESFLREVHANPEQRLGAYDFHGANGFHCVSWLASADLDGRGGGLAELLGGSRRNASSMPGFSRFLLKKANDRVEAVAIYNDAQLGSLANHDIDLIDSGALSRAFRQRGADEVTR